MLSNLLNRSARGARAGRADGGARTGDARSGRAERAAGKRRGGRVRALLTAVLAALPLAAAASAQAQSGGSFALRAGKVYTVDGKSQGPIEGCTIIVRNGVIVAVGKDVAVPPDLTLIELPDATVTPGFVAAAAAPMNSGGPESIRAAYRAADAFDRYEDERETLATGVTTMHLSPGWNRLVPGRGAVVHLGGPASKRMLKEESDLTITLGEGAFNAPSLVDELVPPSSDNAITPAQPQLPAARIGQYLALKEAIQRAGQPAEAAGAAGAGAKFDVHSAALAEAWRSNLPIRVQAVRSADLAGAVNFLAQEKRTGYLVGGTEVASAAELLVQAGVPLVYTVGSSFNTPGRNLGNSPDALTGDLADLSKLAGLKLALGVEPGQGAGDLRLAAATALRSGLSRQRVLEAVTRVPAEILGVSGTVGSLEAGKQADLLILSGDPLSTTTQVERVYVSGRLAYEPGMRRKADATASLDSGAGPLVVRAGTIWMGPGDWMNDGEILIEDGKITQVGKRVSVPRGARVIDAGAHAFVTPGFIDAYGHLGLDGDTGSIGPELSLSGLIGAPDLSELRVARAGVTTVMTAPYRASGQGSRVAAIKTAGTTRDQRVVTDTAGLVFDLGDADPTAVAERLKPRLEAGKRYQETWKKYETELAEWEKKKADGTLEAAKPKVVEEAAGPAKPEDPITGSWRARVFGGPIPPDDEREGTIAFKLTGNQFEGRLIEPVVPVEFRIQGTLDGKKLSGKLEIETRGMGYPTFEGTIDREDHISGTISFQGLTINFEMRRTDKSEVEFKVQTSRKRKTTGKDGRPLPPKVEEGLEPVRLVLEKKIPVVVSCTTAAQIDAALDVLVDQYDLPVVLLNADGARLHSARLKAKNVAVVPAPAVIQGDGADRTAPLDELSRLGVRVGMQSDAEDAARNLPSMALYAVEQGFSPEAALAALTIDTARMYKLDGRLGSIAPGKEGDLVIFSGYPFDAEASIRNVIVGGEEVQR